MVGLRALFAFLGILCGLLAGLWWGFRQSWILGFLASAGGVIAGGILGSIVGFIYEEVPLSIGKLSGKHRVLGAVLLWLFWLALLAGICAFWYAAHLFIRHMRQQ